jgi:hypothetical protein
MPDNIPYSNQSYTSDGASISTLDGLDWDEVQNGEMIRRKSPTLAEGTGITVEDAGSGFDSQKTISLFERISGSPLSQLLGAIRNTFTLLGQFYRIHITPRSTLLGTANGMFLTATAIIDKVKVGINTDTPLHELQVGTTLYADDVNKRVGINQSAPTQDLEVLNTLYVDSTNRRVGVVESNPFTTFQVGNTFYVNATTRRVGIGIDSPEEELEIDGSIQIDSSSVSRLKFQKAGTSPYQEAEVDGSTDGTNGGVLEFFTKVDGGALTEKLRINNAGAIGIGGADYGASGAVLTSQGSGSLPVWKSKVYGTTYFSGHNKPVTAATYTAIKDTGYTWTNFGSFTPATLFTPTQAQSTILIPRNGVYQVSLKINANTAPGTTQDMYFRLKYREASSGTIIDISTTGITDASATDRFSQNHSTITMICEFQTGDELQGDVYMGGANGFIRGDSSVDILVTKMTSMSIHNVD